MLSKIVNFFKRLTSNKSEEYVPPIDSPSVPRVQRVWMGGENGREIVVKSLPIESYLQILPRLENIPAMILQHGRYKHKPIEFLTAGLNVAKDEIIHIIEVSSGLERKFILENVSLPEMVRFIRALYEVNELKFVAGELKTAMGGMLVAAIQAAAESQSDG